MEPFVFQSIGVVRTPFAEKFGTPRQGYLAPTSRAEIEFPAHQPAELWLRGLEGFSHVWLLSVFHAHLNETAPALVRPPRLGGKAVGAFASRSPHRPNPIGLTLAKIETCEGRRLILSGVDLLDGTPLLDLKPYLADADRAHEAKEGWVTQHPWLPLAVTITPAAEIRMDRIYRLCPPPVPRSDFRRLIGETLATDPRAVADRTKILENRKPRRFWLRLYDVDLGFHFIGDAILVDDARFALHSPLYAKFNEQHQYGEQET